MPLLTHSELEDDFTRAKAADQIVFDAVGAELAQALRVVRAAPL